METGPFCHALRVLRQIAAPSDDGLLDAELLEHFVVSRDGGAFGRLVERHGPLVLGVCRRVLNNHHDAEDAFQATFLVLARKAPHVRRRHALAAWLYKVAYHLSVKLKASADRRRQAEQRPVQPRETPAEDQVHWADL